MACNGAVFVAVGIDSSLASASWQSTDNGVTWTSSTSLDSAGALGPTAVAGTGVHFVVLDNSNGVSCSSDSGVTWAHATSNLSVLWNVAASATSFDAVDTAGFIYRSTNFGDTWPSAVLPSGNPLNAITYDGTNFVAVGYNGFVAYSANDGVSWSAATTPPPSGTLLSVGHG